MKQFLGKSCSVLPVTVSIALLAFILRLPLRAEPVSLQAIVTPSTTLLKDGRPVTFAVHGFIELKSLAELFPYIESQTQRWKLSGGLDDAEQKNLARPVRPSHHATAFSKSIGG